MAPVTMSLQKATDDDLVVESKLLGPLDVPTGQIYEFAAGIYGFPNARSFALIPAEREGFFWLQSIESQELTFLLVDPFRFVDDYSVELVPGDLDELDATEPAEVLVLAILTLPREEGGETTANLQGPIAFNVVERVGKQVVIESPYGIRQAVDLRKRAAAE